MKMKQKIVPILIMVVGLMLLAYPFLSNFMFERSASSTIESYQKKADSMDEKEKQQLFLNAQRYNKDLNRSMVQITDPFRLKQSHGERLNYQKILNPAGSGIMGYLRIPCISLELPIYHGTSAEVLEHGIGHLAASSFPIGGNSTHSVLTGHTGLSSAKLFTDLTQMKKGDLFFIKVLDRELAYRVDQITVVRPEDTRKLQIIKGEDHVTLVTCTPYGVNDHRLLVRGIRTRYEKGSGRIQNEHRGSQWMEVYKRAFLAGFLIMTLLITVIKGVKKVRGKTHVKRKERREMKRKLIDLFGMLLMGIGIFVFLSPDLSSCQQQKEADREIKVYEKEAGISKEKDPLYQEAVRYNRRIYENGQRDLKDVWSYRSAPIRLKHKKDSFGCIRIPKMKVRLPLYLGADRENMRKGAAIMGGTSLPIGDKNSNCVIAAHRGYQGIPYFREIERLNVGDSVIVKNRWEKLSYKVERIKIINPDDPEQIRIQKGKDMITLLTCHPYRSHGKFRYVVYCVRDRGQDLPGQKIQMMKDTSFESSKWDIQREKLLRYIGMGILAFFGIRIVTWKER